MLSSPGLKDLSVSFYDMTVFLLPENLAIDATFISSF